VPDLNCFEERTLSPAASDLVRFDADSIGRVVSADGGARPDIWLVDPDQYARNGRLLRDSESPRMLAYSINDQILYGTDGCNVCARHVPAELQSLSPEQLCSFADENEIRLELLEYLVSLM
jgi:hypothetical protein